MYELKEIINTDAKINKCYIFTAIAQDFKNNEMLSLSFLCHTAFI